MVGTTAMSFLSPFYPLYIIITVSIIKEKYSIMKNNKSLVRGLSVLLLIAMLIGTMPLGVLATGTAADASVSPLSEEKSQMRTPSATDLSSKITNLPIPQSKLHPLTSTSVANNLVGTWFILVKSGSAYYAMDISSNPKTNGNLHKDADGNTTQMLSFPTVKITVSNNLISGVTNLNYAITLAKWSGKITQHAEWADRVANERKNTKDDYKNYYPPKPIGTNLDGNHQGYTFRWENGKWRYDTRYLYPGNARAMLTTNASKSYPYFIHYNLANYGYTDEKVSGTIYRVNIAGENSYTYWLGRDPDSSGYLTSATRYQLQRNDIKDKDFAMEFHFFRVNPRTLELYRALTSDEVKNAINSTAYSSEAHRGFLLTVERAINYYTQNNTYSTSDDSIKKQCNAYANMLYDSVKMLKKEATDRTALNNLSANSSNYMDLSMTVLDFRADGLLFENKNNLSSYTLSSRDEDTEATMQNELGLPHPGKNDSTAARVELTLDTLVGGYPTYTKETVAYIARSLVKQHQFSDAPASKFDSNWNSLFISKAQSWTSANEGSWSDTLKKVGLNQGLDGTVEGTNGGVLYYSQVTTAFDLAYYMLNNLWRPVGKDDVLSGTPESNPVYYNMVVDELHTLRLKKGSNGFYTFQSDLDVGRDLNTGTVFNTTNTDDGTSPQLNIITDLGFEHPDRYGNDTTGIKSDHDGTSSTAYAGRTNFNYGIHVSSVFVYYDAKDLQFTFSGDDDVYFFINDQLVCDIGGMHGAVTKGLHVNDVAAKLGLSDGDICTFDMFFIDRHTSGINLNFSTNIEMMAASAITREEQHLYTEAGVINDVIREGAVVEDQTEVSYTYMLLNRSDYGANHLSFTDAQLGVTLTKDQIDLNGKAEVQDLSVTYRGYDPNTSKYVNTLNDSLDYSGVADEAFAESDFYTLISGAVYNKTTTTPFKEQAYRITGLSENQLKALLELGVPANTQIEIYGMHQTALLSVGTCMSTLQTVCYPLDTYDLQGSPLTGNDKRTVQIIEQGTFTVNAPLQLVIDYGKSVEIPVEDLTQTITTSGGAVATFLGFMDEGRHGLIMTAKPSNIKCTTTGETYATPNGIYEYRGNVYRFTPSRFLEEIDRVNAVYSISSLNAVDRWFVIVSLEIIPATMVYYEAEDFVSSEFTYEELTAEGTKSEFTVVQQENQKSISDTAINTYSTQPDPTYDQNILYFGFGDTTQDRLRYEKNPIYGSEQLDTVNEWWYDTNTANWSMSLTRNDGIMKFTGKSAKDSLDYCYIGSGKDSSGNRNYPLCYVPSEEDWMEIRFRIEGTTTGTYNFKLEMFNLTNGNADNHYNHSFSLPSDAFTDGYYVLSDHIGRRTVWDSTTDRGTTDYKLYADLPLITRVNLLFGGIQPQTNVTIYIDYFYIGPKESAPSFQDGYLLFDFDQSAAAQYRYQTEVYDGINYDLGTSWLYDESCILAPEVTNGALKLTASSNNTTGYHWVRTGQDALGQGINYVPSEKDYCQIRLKIENGETKSSSTPYAAICFSTDGMNVPEENKEKYEYDLSEKPVGQWFTLTFPITTELWYNADIITDIHLSIGGLQGINGQAVVVYIDYIYIGPSQGQDLNYTGEEQISLNGNDTLFFDFSGTEEEAERYDQAIYGFRNYTDLTTWKSNSIRNTVNLGEDSLIMHIAAPYVPGVDEKCNPYVQSITPGGDSLSMPLNYIPSDTDVAQVRVRFSNCTTKEDNPIPSFYVYFMGNRTYTTSDGVWIDDKSTMEFDKNAVTSGEWTTITLPLNTAFRSADVINAIRFNFVNVISANNNVGVVEVDYLYIGPENLAPTTECYGYDSSYDNDRGLSDGESLFIAGTGYKTATAKAYTMASFTFTGTGFDIISRTNEKQATLRVTVKNAEGVTERTLTINNKGELDLYQIPVVSMEDFPYGEHTVTIEVNSPVTYTGVLAPLSRGGEFYLDAVRIYDPIDVEKDGLSTEEETVLNAYTADFEAYPYIKEVRDVILSATEFNALVGSEEGAVFIDQAEEMTVPPGFTSGTGGPDVSVDNHITYEIATYEKAGPKNEVYLSNGQSVAFKLLLNTAETPTGIDIGAKAIHKGDTPILTVGYTTALSTAPVIKEARSIETNTAMYYPIQFTEGSFASDTDGRYLYLVISNTGNDSVLSITDLKFTYDCEPTLITEGQPPVKKAGAYDPVSFLVDGGITEAVTKILDARIPVADKVIVDENIAIYHTLNLASDIAISYAIAAESLSGYQDFYLACTLYTGSVVHLEPVLKGEYYYFTLTGLTAVNINDTVEATLFMSADGQRYTSCKDTYSVARYAYSQLSKENIPQSLKTLCAELLRYGAQAQIYKDYRTHDLADSKLTEEQRAYLTDLDTISFGTTNTVGTELSRPVAVWMGKSLDLASKVALTFVFTLEDPTVNYEDLVLSVSYTDQNGKAVTATVKGATVYNEAKGFYAFRFADLLASELRSVLTVQVYHGDTPLSCVLQYSADCYGNNKTGNLGQLCRALFAYSDSAKAYFAK